MEEVLHSETNGTKVSGCGEADWCRVESGGGGSDKLGMVDPGNEWAEINVCIRVGSSLFYPVYLFQHSIKHTTLPLLCNDS